MADTYLVGLTSEEYTVGSPRDEFTISGGDTYEVTSEPVTVTISTNATSTSGGAELSDATPAALGTAAAGVATTAARGDHVHAMPDADDVGAAPAYLVPFSGTIGTTDAFDALLATIGPGLTSVAFTGYTVTAGTIVFDLSGVNFFGLQAPTALLEVPTAPDGLEFAGVRVTRVARSSATGATVSLRLSDASGAIWPVGVQTSSTGWVAALANELVAASVDTADGAWAALTIDDAAEHTDLALNLLIAPSGGQPYPSSVTVAVEWMFRSPAGVESARRVSYIGAGITIDALTVQSGLERLEGFLDSPMCNNYTIAEGFDPDDPDENLLIVPLAEDQVILDQFAEIQRVAFGTTTPDADGYNLPPLYVVDGDLVLHPITMSAEGLTDAPWGSNTNYLLNGMRIFCTLEDHPEEWVFTCPVNPDGTGLPGLGQNLPGVLTRVHTDSAGGTVDVVSNVATSRILGRVTAGSGDSEELTGAQVLTLAGGVPTTRTVAGVDLADDITASELRTALKVDSPSLPMGEAKTNEWIPLFPSSASIGASNVSTTATASNGLLRVAPFFVGRRIGVSGIGFEVSTGNAGASAVIRVGLFAMTAGRPGVVVVQGTATATAAAKEVTFSEVFLDPGWYWLGFAFQSLDTGGTNPAIRAISTTQSSSRASITTGAGQVNSLSLAGVSGAFTDSPTMTETAALSQALFAFLKVSTPA